MRQEHCRVVLLRPRRQNYFCSGRSWPVARGRRSTPPPARSQKSYALVSFASSSLTRRRQQQSAGEHPRQQNDPEQIRYRHTRASLNLRRIRLIRTRSSWRSSSSTSSWLNRSSASLRTLPMMLARSSVVLLKRTSSWAGPRGVSAPPRRFRLQQVVCQYNVGISTLHLEHKAGP